MRVYFSYNGMDVPMEWVQNNQYLKNCLDIKENKRFRGSDQAYSEDLWQGLSVEDYCLKHPIRVNKQTGHYTNFD